jgi:tRNA-2-methylthio-N6-dimethylallyladenosine synthase
MEDSDIIAANPEYGFPELLEDVCKIPGLKRVRFMTPHPKDLSDRLIEVIARNPKVCRHIHLPVQSGSSEILRRMNRHYTKEQYLALVDKIRAAIPDISITTDIMVGFPGETEADIEDTLDVVRKARYDQAFTFIYSRRTGTPAAAMEQVPEALVKKWFDRLLQVVMEGAHERCLLFEGQTVTVLVEERNESNPELLTGRLESNMVVHFPGEDSLIGKLVRVKLDKAHGFYYSGTYIEEESE